MPHSLWDHLTDQVSRLEKVSMTIVEYESYFHELSRHATSIMGIKYERIYCFVRGLRLPLRISTQSLVVVDSSFSNVSNHAQVMEEI